jgi:hypothetical protein
MINWQPTSPLLNRPPAHLKTSKDSRFDDWSIAELLRGERSEPPRLNGARGRGYDPHQPRVPAGHSDGGQWTREENWFGTRFAATERPPLGPAGRAHLALQIARKLIDAFRAENGLQDLFGRREGAVTVTTIDGKHIFGSNSGLSLYQAIDRAEANRLRASILQKYPDLIKTGNIGQMPLDALFHAETNVLLRAARQHGGSLHGRVLEVYGDRPMCNRCDKILPYVGLELGNPTVTFVGPSGTRDTMRDGRWVDKEENP